MLKQLCTSEQHVGMVMISWGCEHKNKTTQKIPVVVEKLAFRYKSVIFELFPIYTIQSSFHNLLFVSAMQEFKITIFSTFMINQIKTPLDNYESNHMCIPVHIHLYENEWMN